MNSLLKLSSLFSLTSVFAFFGCASKTVTPVVEFVPSPEKPIVIVYENDAHCAVNGYAKFAGIRDSIANAANVLAVSSGDYLQGGAMGSISRGAYIVDLINSAGYDVVTLGNHEFDFAVDRLMELSKKVRAEIVNANFSKANSHEPIFKPYVMKMVGSKKIAFVGVLTPEALLAESQAFYDSTGVSVYHLHENEVYKVVQNAVDNAIYNGADYVILLAHLGEEVPVNSSVTSHELIKNTFGINAVLDGHAHSVVEELWLTNAKGDSVLLTQTGTKFANVGKLEIDGNGRFHSSLIPVDSATVESPKVRATIDSLNSLTSAVLQEKLTETSFDLTIEKEGRRAVRNGETNLGDLVADAFRVGTGAQIGLVNGGGVRVNISKGTITYQNVLDASPFFNDVCKIEATGLQILGALEQGSQKYPNEYGGFLQVSGLRYEIHSTAQPRVQNVLVESENGEYVPLETDRLYTVGLTSYVARKGTEITAFKSSKILVDGFAADSDMLTHFFKSFDGAVPERYAEPQGRIVVK